METLLGMKRPDITRTSNIEIKLKKLLAMRQQAADILDDSDNDEEEEIVREKDAADIDYETVKLPDYEVQERMDHFE